MGGDPSHIPAHTSPAAAAPFEYDRVHKLVLREDQSLHRFCSAQGYPRRQDGLFSIRPPIATLSINY